MAGRSDRDKLPNPDKPGPNRFCNLALPTPLRSGLGNALPSPDREGVGDSRCYCDTCTSARRSDHSGTETERLSFSMALVISLDSKRPQLRRPEREAAHRRLSGAGLRGLQSDINGQVRQRGGRVIHHQVVNLGLLGEVHHDSESGHLNVLGQRERTGLRTGP